MLRATSEPEGPKGWPFHLCSCSLTEHGHRRDAAGPALWQDSGPTGLGMLTQVHPYLESAQRLSVVEGGGSLLLGWLAVNGFVRVQDGVC